MRVVSGTLCAAALMLAAACAAAGQAHLSGEEPDLEAELTALLQRLDDAAAAGDMDRFLSLFVDGPELAYAINGRVFTDLAEVHAFHTAALSKLRSVRFATRPVRIVRLGPDHAALTAAGETERVLATGQPRTGRYAVTLVLRRDPQGWRVLQVHESSLAP